MFKINTYSKLVKFSHTLFAMPFALIGYFLAAQQDGYGFNSLLLVYVILCMIFARNAAMAFNRYIDRESDALNQRTRMREIPIGAISPRSSLIFILINSLFFILTTYFINPLCFYLSPVALGVILGYSYTKKFTWLCHFILGIGLALAPLGAYLAVSGKFALMPMLFSFLVITWVSGFDILYSLQDETFDRNENLKSIPVAAGTKNALLFSLIIHLSSIFFITLIGITGKFGVFYTLGAIMFSALLLYQHLVLKQNDLSRINLAFFTLNGIASLLFGFFTIVSFYI